MTTYTEAPATPETTQKSVTAVTPSEAYLESTAFQLRQVANYFNKNVHELEPISFLVAMQWAHRVRQGEKDVSLAKIEHSQTVSEITSYFAEEPDDEDAENEPKKPFTAEDPSGNE